jgi:hypothetical protein
MSMQMKPDKSERSCYRRNAVDSIYQFISSVQLLNIISLLQRSKHEETCEKLRILIKLLRNV